MNEELDPGRGQQSAHFLHKVSMSGVGQTRGGPLYREGS